MTFQIKKATKTATKLRLAIFGPSGSGKTMTSLRLATGLGTRIGLIDSERGSAAKYSDRWPFDVIELEQPTIDHYTGSIHAFADAGHDVLVIDSLSHAWEWLLDFVDKLGASKYRGNKWSAWSEATPKQQALVDAILSYPGHVIATMRSKTEWVQETNDRGKSTPVRVGLAPKQRDGVEYEFDMLLEMNVDNIGRVIKDRTGKFQDRMITKPDEAFGRELGAWLSEGAPAPAPAAGQAPAAAAGKAAPRTMTRAQWDELAILLAAESITEPEQQLAFLGLALGRELGSLRDVGPDEAAALLGMNPRGDDWMALLERFGVAMAGGPPEDEPDFSGVGPVEDAQPIAFDQAGKADRKQKRGVSA